MASGKIYTYNSEDNMSAFIDSLHRDLPPVRINCSYFVPKTSSHNSFIYKNITGERLSLNCNRPTSDEMFHLK